MKMDDKKKNNQPMDEETFLVASTMDCTGLIPSLPANQDEIDSYQELHHIPDQGSREEFQPEPAQPQ